MEFIDLNEIRKWFAADSGFPVSKNNNAMLCLLQNQQTNDTIVVGNAHLEHKPEWDHVKFAQAAFLVDKAAKYVRENGNAPFICCGDFNSLPVSSVLSVFYGENIEDEDKWSALTSSVNDSDRHFYRDVNKLLQRKAENGLLEPLFGHLQSAYHFYNLPVGRSPEDQTLTRD